MFDRKGTRLIYRYDAEKLWVEPWGANAFRIRATKMSSMPTEDWALQEPAPSEVNISLSDKVSPEPPLNALDCIISTEIPDERQHPALRAVVLQTNMHHRNHLNRAISHCNKNGRCIYGFPHPMTDRTTMDERGRVHFQRGEEQSFMSDLLWYFRRQREPIFNNLTYTDFYAQYYFTMRDRDRPLDPN